MPSGKRGRLCAAELGSSPGPPARRDAGCALALDGRYCSISGVILSAASCPSNQLGRRRLRVDLASIHNAIESSARLLAARRSPPGCWVPLDLQRWSGVPVAGNRSHRLESLQVSTGVFWSGLALVLGFLAGYAIVASAWCMATPIPAEEAASTGPVLCRSLGGITYEGSSGYNPSLGPGLAAGAVGASSEHSRGSPSVAEGRPTDPGPPLTALSVCYP